LVDEHAKLGAGASGAGLGGRCTRVGRPVINIL